MILPVPLVRVPPAQNASPALVSIILIKQQKLVRQIVQLVFLKIPLIIIAWLVIQVVQHVLVVLTHNVSLVLQLFTMILQEITVHLHV